jgi:hypothetical protein
LSHENWYDVHRLRVLVNGSQTSFGVILDLIFSRLLRFPIDKDVFVVEMMVGLGHE